jgi:hypothetical protein
VETDIWELLLRKGKRVACIGKEHISAVLVYRHICVLAALEICKLLGIVALNPAGLVY